jgi:hypothetical protein
MIIEEADCDTEIGRIAEGCAYLIGILRLRLANRFALRQTPLRMTNG